MSTTPLSPIERIKAESRFLRGTLTESLEDDLTGGLRADDQPLLKFHGSYQQDDRDVREERRLQKLEPAYDFMIRTRLPGGVCTPAQWLALDDIAAHFSNHTLRLTTRQAFQVHGVVKHKLKPTMAAINAALIDTIAACGDVNRNVLCNPNPVASALHAQVFPWAVRLSEHLLPKTNAYYEIWLDKEKVAGGEDEPIYGPTYLPRKFKAAIAIPPINDVDVYAHCLGFIAIAEGDRREPSARGGDPDGFAGGEGARSPLGTDRLIGFNVTVGGGMGASHGDATTYPRIADEIGFCTPEQLLAVAEQVVCIQRDFGNRAERKHARLKYTIAHRGLPWFVEELTKRLGFALAPARPVTFEHNGDRYGWVQGVDGKWHLTLHLDSGRIFDQPEDPTAPQLMTGLREVARIHKGDFRLTPNQNLIIASVASEDRPQLDALLAKHGVDGYRTRKPVHLNALACVALPTCTLAMAEAERYLPTLVGKVEELLGRHGLADERLHLRITGCPNGCARPYLAEVALVGKGPGRYNLMLGGNHIGRRVATLYRENVDETEALAALDPLLAAFAKERQPGEAFGDFAERTAKA
jgi:sulfite reductase (NADPH) hemoprotein beta-component